MLAPFITSTAQQVLITLTPPTTPNGIILEYQVERSLAGEGNFTVIGVLDGASIALALVDTDTEPFTTYDYRAVAVNSAGAARGPAVNFTTPEAGKVQSVLLSIVLALQAFSTNFSLIWERKDTKSISMTTDHHGMPKKCPWSCLEIFLGRTLVHVFLISFLFFTLSLSQYPLSLCQNCVQLHIVKLDHTPYTCTCHFNCHHHFFCSHSCSTRSCPSSPTHQPLCSFC